MTATNTQSNEMDWERGYRDMETFVYEIAYMAQIADNLFCESASDDDRASQNRLAFAVSHVRTMRHI